MPLAHNVSSIKYPHIAYDKFVVAPRWRLAKQDQTAGKQKNAGF
jgi:hypothetical protein